ncbi:MAG TPA: nitronate monooxygenase [Gammaproteobacteria bacterium]
MPAGDSFSRLRTPVCDLLGCEYPILQAGMGGVARAELVSAVTAAGGYGFLGMVREPPQRIADEIGKVREQTGKPFGVNIIPAATEPALLERQVEVCLREKVHSVCLFWDVDAKLIGRLREAGILVLHQVGGVADADDAWRAGAQILIAQGREAGGHVRGEQSVLTLTPQIVDATPLPVIASGGIVDGRQMAAVMMLGAQGIHCGTLFLATFESNAHDYHKRRVVQAKSEDTLHTTLFHINWPDHAPVRVIQNSVTRGEHDSSRIIIGQEDERPIYLFSTDSPLRETDGDLEAMALYAGQGVSAINAIVPARQRIEDLLRQAAAAFDTREKSHHGSIGKVVTG